MFAQEGAAHLQNMFAAIPGQVVVEVELHLVVSGSALIGDPVIAKYADTRNAPVRRRNRDAGRYFVETDDRPDVLFFRAKIPQLDVAIVNAEARVVQNGRAEDAV